jgi:hypothetical protein
VRLDRVFAQSQTTCDPGRSESKRREPGDASLGGGETETCHDPGCFRQICLACGIEDQHPCRGSGRARRNDVDPVGWKARHSLDAERGGQALRLGRPEFLQASAEFIIGAEDRQFASVRLDAVARGQDAGSFLVRAENSQTRRHRDHAEAVFGWILGQRARIAGPVADHRQCPDRPADRRHPSVEGCTGTFVDLLPSLRHADPGASVNSRTDDERSDPAMEEVLPSEGGERRMVLVVPVGQQSPPVVGDRRRCQQDVPCDRIALRVDHGGHVFRAERAPVQAVRPQIDLPCPSTGVVRNEHDRSGAAGVRGKRPHRVIPGAVSEDYVPHQ